MEDWGQVTTTTTLADGSPSYMLTALGTVDVQGERRIGTILLNSGSGPNAVLAGMAFLSAFEKTLILYTRMDQAKVLLVDNTEAEAIGWGPGPQ